MKSSRLVAFETLYKISKNGAYSNIALAAALKDRQEDKQFISSLVYGVTERRLTLDWFIDKYARGSVKPKLRIILRMGAYQLLFMDKVPPSAAVNESVKLVREIKQDYYAGFVNAVLRKIDADRAVPDGDISLKYSVPQPLINMWCSQYTREKTLQFLPCVNGRPPVFAVVNTIKTDTARLCSELEDSGVECYEYDDGVLKIASPFDLSALDAFKNGLFYIEDYSSFCCARALGAKPGDTVLDMCAAPGGKSFAAAIGMQNRGTVYSYDLYESRAGLINDGAKRLGIDIIKTGVNDAAVYNDEIPAADRILCDVPCSGFGIIRRKPEIRYKSLDDVKALPELQLKILETSSDYLKNGGSLLYSTCTLNKRENEKVTAAFLERHGDFALMEEKTVFPSEDGGDGFYYALTVKNEN